MDVTSPDRRALLEAVLPYVKASVPEGDPASVVMLAADDFPVFEPFVGVLRVAYVLDAGGTLRLLTEGEVREAGLASDELRRAALSNLQTRFGETGVRLAPYGRIVAVLADGNFEATMMLWDDLWPHLHERLGPELYAVAPARDILAVAGPDGVRELREVVARAWPGGDHLLTRGVFVRVEGAWRVLATE